MGIESACIPLPSEIIMPFSGFLVYTGRFNLWAVSVAGAVGCVVGSLVAYWVGMYGGRPFIEKYGRYVLISQHDLDLADRWFARRGELIVFTSRLLPVIRTFIAFPAGVAKMNLTRFVAYTFLGSLPWCLALAYAGQKLGEHWTDVSGVLRKYDVLVGIGILALVALFLYRHLRRQAVGGRR